MGDWQEDAPDPETLSDLLRGRHRIDPTFTVTVTLSGDPGEPEATVAIERPPGAHRPRQRTVIEVQFQGFIDAGAERTPHADGEGPPSRWEATLDTLDALVGQLVEAGYAHRELPYGDGLEHAGATFGVKVEQTRPDIDAVANKLLGDS